MEWVTTGFSSTTKPLTQWLPVRFCSESLRRANGCCWWITCNSGHHCRPAYAQLLPQLQASVREKRKGCLHTGSASCKTWRRHTAAKLQCRMLISNRGCSISWPSALLTNSLTCHAESTTCFIPQKGYHCLWWLACAGARRLIRFRPSCTFYEVGELHSGCVSILWKALQLVVLNDFPLSFTHERSEQHTLSIREGPLCFYSLIWVLLSRSTDNSQFWWASTIIGNCIQDSTTLSYWYQSIIILPYILWDKLKLNCTNYPRSSLSGNFFLGYISNYLTVLLICKHHINKMRNTKWFY